MAWIKRNIWFVVSAVLGLALTGYCCFLLYGAMQANAAANEDYQSKLQNLQQLTGTPPFPSREAIQSVKEDQKRIQQFLDEFRTKFAPFPPPPALDEKGFGNYLIDKLTQFRAEATNAGVELPPGYEFGFAQLVGKLNYPPANIQPWLQQLEEIETILGVVFRAKVTYLSQIKRPPVSPDDASLADCLQAGSVTNQWGIVTPYQIYFRGFSADLAAVLDGFARSSNCFIVKTVSVTPDTTVTQQQHSYQPEPTPTQTPVSMYRPIPQPQNALRGRGPGGILPGGYRPPPMTAPVANQAAAAAGNQAPVTILSEGPLSIIITVDAVKLKASEP